VRQRRVHGHFCQAGIDAERGRSLINCKKPIHVDGNYNVLGEIANGRNRDVGLREIAQARVMHTRPRTMPLRCYSTMLRKRSLKEHRKSLRHEAAINELKGKGRQRAHRFPKMLVTSLANASSARQLPARRLMTSRG